MTKKQSKLKTAIVTVIITVAAIATTGCALGVATLGADLTGPALNTLLDPVGSVQTCPDCPKGMSATEYIKQQEEMKKKAQQAAMKQYYQDKEQAEKAAKQDNVKQLQQSNQQ